MNGKLWHYTKRKKKEKKKKKRKKVKVKVKPVTKKKRRFLLVNIFFRRLLLATRMSYYLFCNIKILIKTQKFNK